MLLGMHIIELAYRFFTIAQDDKNKKGDGPSPIAKQDYC